MTWRHIGALVANEIRLHGRGALIVQVGILFVLVAGYQLKPGGRAAFSFLLNCNWMTALAWSEWLVSREKTKGTIAWLRTLPVRDSDIISAKFVAHALCCVVFWTGTSWLSFDVFSRDPSLWVASQLGLIALGGMSIASRWRFSQRIGSLAPLMILLPVALLFMNPRVNAVLVPEVSGLWERQSGKFLAMALIAAVYAATWAATVLWVSRVDTSELLE